MKTIIPIANLRVLIIVLMSIGLLFSPAKALQGGGTGPLADSTAPKTHSVYKFHIANNGPASIGFSLRYCDARGGTCLGPGASDYQLVCLADKYVPDIGASFVSQGTITLPGQISANHITKLIGQGRRLQESDGTVTKTDLSVTTLSGIQNQTSNLSKQVKNLFSGGQKPEQFLGDHGRIFGDDPSGNPNIDISTNAAGETVLSFPLRSPIPPEIQALVTHDDNGQSHDGVCGFDTGTVGGQARKAQWDALIKKYAPTGSLSNPNNEIDLAIVVDIPISELQGTVGAGLSGQMTSFQGNTSPTALVTPEPSVTTAPTKTVTGKDAHNLLAAGVGDPSLTATQALSKTMTENFTTREEHSIEDVKSIVENGTPVVAFVTSKNFIDTSTRGFSEATFILTGVDNGGNFTGFVLDPNTRGLTSIGDGGKGSIEPGKLSGNQNFVALVGRK